jgi:hypothetical protein
MKTTKKYLYAACMATSILLCAGAISTSTSTPTPSTNVGSQVTDLQNFGAASSVSIAAPTPTPTPAVGPGVAPNGDPGGFEIEGDLRASSSPSRTDWLDTTLNSGIGGLLFENGSPKNPTVTFRRSDVYAANDDVFPGGMKVNDNPSTYTWLTNSANNKTDMNNVYVHISKDANVPAHTWITASGDRYVTNGTAYIDFELNQAAVTKVTDNTTCSLSQQPCGNFVTNPAGKNLGDPLFATGGRTPNDLLITANYGQGGSVATIIISQWANVGGTYQWKDVTPMMPTSSAFVATYTGANPLPVPYGAFGGPNYIQNQFVEMSVDVTKLIGLAGDACAGIIVKSVFVKTKTSTTSTATLMDFADPIGVTFSAGFVVDATAQNPSCSTDTASITATFSGGTSPFQCALDNGSFATCTSPQTYSGVAAGSHTVTVKDSSGCTKTTNPVNISIPSAVTASGTETDPNCSDGFGSMQVTFSGGTPGYTCSLDGASFAACTSPATFSSLTNGSHTVTVKDSKGCPAPDVSKTVTIPPGVTTSGTETDPNCSDGFGSMQVTFSGGTPGYQCSLDNGSFAACTSPATFNNLTNGSHTVTVKDSKGCPGPAVTKTVTIPPGVTTSGTETDPNCSDGFGSMQVTFSGGTPGYTCSLDAGSFAACTSPATFNNLSTGSHTVTVKDSKGCLGPAVTKTVTIPSGLTASGTETDPNCSDGFGSITATFSGGTGPFQCSLDSGAFAACTSPATFGSLTNGSHTVTVKDSKGCLGPAVTKTVTIPPAVTASGTETDPNCSDGTGSITATFAGGTGSYQCSLDSGAFAACTSPATFGSLANGSHTVAVKDSKGCLGPAVTKTVTIPTAVNASGTETDPNCSDGFGSIQVTFSGGTSGYTCSLDNGAFAACTSPATFGNLNNGSHTVTVKDSKGCLGPAVTKTVTIPSGVLASGTETDPNCSDGFGSMQVTFSGGTPGYSCSLDNGTFAACASPATFGNLNNGSHTVAVKDSKGCLAPTVTKTVTIPSGVLASGTETDPNCSDGFGSIQVTFSGGTPGYTCSLDGGAFAACTSPAGFSNLGNGSHTVTVKDSKGCLAPDVTKTVTIPSGVLASGTETDPNCSDGFGGIQVTFSGGTPGYTCSLDGGAFAACTSPATFGNLSNGSHTVTVKDSKGCPAPDVTKTVTIPSGMLASGTETDPNCGDGFGSIQVTFSGGTPGYTCSLDGSAFAACTSPATFGNLSNGSHTVTVKDNKGCLAPDVTKTVTIPTAVNASGTETDPNCSDGFGSIQVTFSGGTPGYSCSLDNGAFAACTSPATFGTLSNGSHTVTVKDSKGCLAPDVTKTVTIPSGMLASGTETDPNCSDGFGSIQVTFSGGTPGYTCSLDNGAFAACTSPATFGTLGNGSHTVAVKDSKGCLAPAVTKTVTIPTAISGSETTTPASCNGGTNGSVTVTVSGGTAPYSVTVNGVTHAVATSGGSTTFMGLASGTYSAAITDKNDCPGSAPGVPVGQSSTIIASEMTTPASCNGGSDGTVTVTVGGGAPPYSVTVSGVTKSVTASGGSATFMGLASGFYPATISDVAGCPGAATGVLVDQPSAITASEIATPASCNGGNDGTVKVTVGGGTPPYSVTVNAVTKSVAASGGSVTFTGLASGTYPATISDNNNCPSSATGVLVGQPSAITASESTTPASCNASDGTVTVTVSGGTPPYSVTVNGATKSLAASGGSVTFMGLASGTYSATISDQNLCPGAATGVPVGQQSCGCTTTSSITSNFNGTSISPSNYIWFNANFNASGITNGTTITLTGSSIDIVSAGGTHYTKPIPDGIITFSSSATCASTTFSGGKWLTTVPVSGSDEIFLSGLLIKAGDITNSDLKASTVTWTGGFSTNKSGVTLNWKWGAAVYQANSTVSGAANAGGNPNNLNVKPTHSNACGFNNGDHAGTPENKKIQQSVIGGARGGGGSNFTGSWSGTQNVAPCFAGTAPSGSASMSALSLQNSSATTSSTSTTQPASNICPATGSLRTLTMTYEGRNAGGGTVAGNPGGLDAAYIVVTGGSSNLFSGAVSFNSKADPGSAYFVIDGGNAPLPQQATVTIYTARGGAKVSTVTFDTSCKQPLNVGDYFGSLRVSTGSQ